MGFEAPDLDACAASVFWRPDWCPAVLPVKVAPSCDLAERRVPIPLDRLECRITILRYKEEQESILFDTAGRALQIAITSGSILHAEALLTDALIGIAVLPAHLHTLRCLADLLATQLLRPTHYPPDPRRRRHAQLLQALDGWLAGASQYDIAHALVGAERAARDWRDPGDHLRDHVRRAIRRARALMDGGYRGFLT